MCASRNRHTNNLVEGRRRHRLCIRNGVCFHADSIRTFSADNIVVYVYNIIYSNGGGGVIRSVLGSCKTHKMKYPLFFPWHAPQRRGNNPPSVGITYIYNTHCIPIPMRTNVDMGRRRRDSSYTAAAVQVMAAKVEVVVTRRWCLAKVYKEYCAGTGRHMILYNTIVIESKQKEREMLGYSHR